MNNGYNNQNMNGFQGPMNGMQGYPNNQQGFMNGPYPPQQPGPQPPHPPQPGPQFGNQKPEPATYDETIAKLDKEIEESKKADKKIIMIIVAIVGFFIVAVIVSFIVNGIFSTMDNMEKDKKREFAKTASYYIKNAKLDYSDSSLSKIEDETILILMPVGNMSDTTCVYLETGGASPYSQTWKYAYVAMIYSKRNHMFDYYFVGIDGEGNGIKFASDDELSEENTKLDELVVKDMGEYGPTLYTMYQGGKNHAKASVATYGDSELSDFAEKVGATSVVVLSNSDCAKLKS